MPPYSPLANMEPVLFSRLSQLVDTKLQAAEDYRDKFNDVHDAIEDPKKHTSNSVVVTLSPWTQRHYLEAIASAWSCHTACQHRKRFHTSEIITAWSGFGSCFVAKT